MTLTGFAVGARAFVRINLYAAGVVVLGAGAVSWLSARLRRVLVSADCARCRKLAGSYVNRSWHSA